MKIAVFVKQVEDSRTVRIDSGSGLAQTTGDAVMNPADAIAVSHAIDLKEASSGETTAVTIGPKKARDVVVEAMATGVDGGIHVVAENVAGGDSRVIANALAEAVGDGGYDVLIAGSSAMDFGTGQVGVQIAEALRIPHIMNVTGVTPGEGTLTVARELDGFPDELDVQTPVLLVFAPSEEGPKRHATLRGMMQAKRKTVAEVSTSVEMASELSWGAPTAQRSSADRIMLEGGTAAEAAAQLAAWLRERRLVG